MIHPKLKGLPRIYYINLDQCVDRRNWMENQFKNFGIVNYNRVNASEFLVKDYDKWKDNKNLVDLFKHFDDKAHFEKYVKLELESYKRLLNKANKGKATKKDYFQTIYGKDVKIA